MLFCIKQVNVGHGLMGRAYGVREGAPGTESGGVRIGVEFWKINGCIARKICNECTL